MSIHYFHNIAIRCWGSRFAVVVASGVIGFVDNDVAATASVVALLVLLKYAEGLVGQNGVTDRRDERTDVRTVMHVDDLSKDEWLGCDRARWDSTHNRTMTSLHWK